VLYDALSAVEWFEQEFNAIDPLRRGDLIRGFLRRFVLMRPHFDPEPSNGTRDHAMGEQPTLPEEAVAAKPLVLCLRLDPHLGTYTKI